MKSTLPPVPNHPLSPLAKAGVLVRRLAAPAAAEHHFAAPHRDAHYLLVLLTGGELKLTLDFEQLTLAGPTLLLISPGQVHQLRGAVAPLGWGVSFEPGLLAEEPRQLLEQALARPLALQAQAPFYGRAQALLALLTDCQDGAADAYTGRTLHTLLAALLSLVAGQLAPDPAAQPRETRGTAILQGFRELLRQHFTEWKQPAQYASALAVTVSHLNDTVKALTGLSVSAHLLQRTVLEAKRLLYHTERSVKQIGYELGYDEPVYFGKLFKKATGLTPQQFRRNIRD